MTVLRRVRWGVGELLWPAVAACLLAAIAYTVGGDHARARRPSLVTVCIWYLSAALAGGVVLGLVKPLTKSAFGLGVTGFLVAIPVTLIVLFRNPFERVDIDPANVGIALAIAAVFGPLTAAYVVIRNRQREAGDRDA